MKSRLRSGTHSKARESKKLSDAQLLEKFGIKKCYVKLYRMKSDDYDLSDANSLLMKTDKTPNDESKHQISEVRHRELRNRKHFDSEIIKNDTQNLHNETLEKCTDHRHLPETSENTIDLPTKDNDRIVSHLGHHLDSTDYIFKNREEMNSAGTYLAWKRSNKSSSNLDYRISEATLAGLEESGGIKLPEEQGCKAKIIMNACQSSRKTLDFHKYAEIRLDDHKQETNVSLRQTRKKDRTSTDSKRPMHYFGSECLGMAFSRPDQIEESNLLETDLTKNNSGRSSCYSSRETQNFDFEHPENTIGYHDLTVRGDQAETRKRKQQRNRNFLNREIKNLDIKYPETVIATQENRGERSRIQIRCSSNSSREVQNQYCDNSEIGVSSREQEKELSEIDLSGKNIKGCTITSREKQNIDFLRSKEIHTGPVETANKTNSRKIGWIKSNRNFSNSNRISQNLDSGSSESTPVDSEKMEECNLSETDLSRKNRTNSSFNSNSRTQNFSSESLKIARHEQEEPTVIDLSIKKRTRSSSACINSKDFNSGYSATMLFGHENKEDCNLKEIDLSIKNRTRSSSTSDIRAQDFNSEYSKKLLPRKTEESNLKEIDLSIKNRIRNSSSSIGFQEDSGTLLSGNERAVESNLKEIDLSKKNRARSSSNSCIGTQNLEYLYSQETLYEHKPSKGINQIAVGEKKNSNTSDSIRINPNFNFESSETAPTNHEQTEETNQIQTRSRKSNRIPSDSNREAHNFYETVIVNPEKELGSSLMEIGLAKNKDKSPIFSNSEPENSGIVSLKRDQMEKIYQTPTAVCWRNRPRSSSNSSEGTESFNSEFSEDLPIKSKQPESNQTKNVLLENKRSLDSDIETQNFSSDYSCQQSSRTKEESIVVSDHVSFPKIKKTRYSSFSSNNFLEIRSSQLGKKSEEHCEQIRKEEKECINSAHDPNVEEENSVLPMSRTTRNFSSFSRIRNINSVLSENHTSHMQSQNIDLMPKSNLLPKKRSQSFLNSNNAMKVLHSEHGQKHFVQEQTQGVYLDCNLPAKKRVRNSFSLSSTLQNSDSESSKKYNEHLKTQEFSLNSNLSLETESRSPAVLNNEAQNSDFSKMQKKCVQANESNQPEEYLCLNKNQTASNLDCRTKEFLYKFLRQNPDDLKEQEVPEILTAPDPQQEAAENTIASDLSVSEKTKDHVSSSKQVNASHFGNSCVKDYHANDETQTLAPACFNLNDKYEGSISETVGKKNSEAELEKGINRTDQQGASFQQAISSAETSSCLNNKHILSYTEILKTSEIEKNEKVPSDLMEQQGSYPSENKVQELDVEGENSESEFAEGDAAEKNLENQDKFVEELENLMDCEKFLQDRACTSSNSRDLDPNVKHLKLDDGTDCDSENTKIYKEESLDAILKKEYGIKDCRVLLKRPKPFSVYYGISFLKEIARKGYLSSPEFNVVNLEMLYRRESFSRFSSLNQETFEHEVMKYIERFYLRDEFLKRRRELIEKNEAQLLAIKKSMKRKVYYDESYVFIKDERVQEVRDALKNNRYPLVLLEKNQEAEYLARELVESRAMNIEQDSTDEETSDQEQSDVSTYQQPENYRECDQYLEVDESEEESDQSDSEESKIFYDSSDDESAFSNETQNSVTSFLLGKSSNSLQIDENLRDSNLDDKRGQIGKQRLICNSQQPFQQSDDDDSSSINSKSSENQLRLQNDDDSSTSINSKSSENQQSLQNDDDSSTSINSISSENQQRLQNDDDSSTSINSKSSEDQQRLQNQYHLTLHSAKFKKAIEDSHWPRVLLHPLGGTTEKECIKCLPTAVSERRVPFRHTDDSERTDTNSVLENVEYDESRECSSPSLGSETSLSSNNDSENKSSVAANEEFFVIDDDDSDEEDGSERSSSYSDSEYCSEADQRQSGTESQESHQNRDLFPL